MIDYIFKNPPDISDEQREKCRETGNYTGIAFEWTKYLGIIAIKFANLDRNSTVVRVHSKINIAILQGMLNRSGRLIFSIIHLASHRKFEETIRIIFRCVIETIFTFRWLIKFSGKDSFNRYLRDSLDGDYEFRQVILGEIENRSNTQLVIEERMLKSISRNFELSGMSFETFKEHKKLPNFKQICEQLDLGDMAYVTMMRMGSHSIHGTWTDLLANYIDYSEEEFRMADNTDSDPGENYFTAISLFLIESFQDYANFMLDPCVELSEIHERLAEIQTKVIDYRDEAARPDYQSASAS